MDSRFIHLLTAQLLTILVGIYPYLVRRTRIAFYFAGAHVCLALWCLNETTAFLPGGHDTKLLIFRLSYIIGILMVWFFVHFLLGIAEIPVSRFPQSWRAIQIGGIISIALTFTPWLTVNIEEYGHPFQEIPGPAYPVFIVYMLWGLGLPLYQLGRAYKNTHGHTRTQLKYLFFASCFAFLEGLIFFASLYIPKISHYYFYLQVFYVVLLAYAIAAHHLMDITVIIRKTLEYSIITAVLMGIYLGIITAGAYLIGKWTPLSSNYSSALAAMTIAFIFQPLRTWIQEWLNQKFFRQSTNMGEALGTFTDHLSGRLGAAELAKAVLEVLNGLLHLKFIGFYLRNEPRRMYEGYSSSLNSSLPGELAFDDPWAVAAAKEPVVLPAAAKEWGVVALFPMKGPSGLAGFLFFGEKLSEEKITEQERQLVQRVLEQATLAYEQMTFYAGNSEMLDPGLLSDVARGFVHEMKTPLANIHMPAQAIMLELDALEKGARSIDVLLPKFKERMKFIIAQAFNASERIDAIRQFASVSDTRVEPVDLSKILHESISSLEPLLEKTSARVHYQPPGGVPLVRANPKQLEIVFVNLIKNAVEAMSDKAIPGQNRHLWITTKKEGPSLIVAVKDSGPGIKAEDLSNIFDRYFTTKGKNGTGVGLHLSRQLIEALGGTLTAVSQPNQGATFYVQLPVFTGQNSNAFHAA